MEAVKQQWGVVVLVVVAVLLVVMFLSGPLGERVNFLGDNREQLSQQANVEGYRAQAKRLSARLDNRKDYLRQQQRSAGDDVALLRRVTDAVNTYQRTINNSDALLDIKGREAAAEQLVQDEMFALAEPQLIEIIQDYQTLLGQAQVIQFELDESAHAMSVKSEMRVAEAQETAARLICQRLGRLQESIQQRADEAQTFEDEMFMHKQQKEQYFEELQQARSDGEPSRVEEFRSQMHYAEEQIREYARMIANTRRDLMGLERELTSLTGSQSVDCGA